LNDILYEKYSTSKNLDIDYLPIFSITFAAHYFFISLSIPGAHEGQEFHIYSSENNDRMYDEDTDSYESFEVFIRRKLDEITYDINKIKIPKK